MKNVIITGATGMIGTALIFECVKKRMNVTAVARPMSPRRDRIPRLAAVNVIECGLAEMDKLPSLMAGKYDVFFHLGWADTDHAGRNDAQKQAKNVDAALQAVRAAAKLKCKVFVGAGSQAEYGRYDRPISEDFALKPETEYGKAKQKACEKTAEFCAALKMKHVWTRIFSVYGPNDSAETMISYCIRALLKGEKPRLTKCEQVWDYLYCSDAARALILAAEKGKNKAVYNIGSGISRPLLEFVLKIRDIINPGLEAGIGEKEYGLGQVMHLAADITKLKKDTGFKPSVAFEQGIKETILWNKETYR